jgi:pimeloyl-ACP methyl ester carboxylesterase
VLGHNNFGITDNFFAIGGHSLAAVRLMAEIQRHFAVELPIATIFHAPEIALMSGLLARSNATAEDCDPCLVPLQPEGHTAPLFVIHGYGGDVFCYTAFARALSPQRPVYGLQALGIDGAFEPHRSVEEMAEHYAHLIDEHWPDGVIHLLGQSAGGWVVWAVATVLLRRGRRLGMVAILDSGTTAAISLRLRGLLLLRRTMGRIPAYAAQLRFSTRPRQLLAFFRERYQNLSSHLGWFWQGASHSSEELVLPLGGDQGGPDYFDLLHRRYRPSPLPLRVHLFVSQQDPSVKEHLWRAMACGGLELFQLFEQHHHFHDPSYAGELAAAIAAVLDSEFD